MRIDRLDRNARRLDTPRALVRERSIMLAHHQGAPS